MSYQDLEFMVCGAKVIDLDMLRRHTNYKAPLKENSILIKYFWETVNEFNEFEKVKLIKFCWA